MLHRFRGFFGSDLAVDLGTVNTLIGVAGEGLVLDEPSVVAVTEGTHRVLGGGCAVGHLARQMLGRTPDSIDVAHPLRAGVIADFELCEAMLRYFLRKARRQGWQLRPRVLVAVPGCITPVEKQALYSSAQRAGAGHVYLVPEYKAAAIGAGLPVAEPVASMICDIGGGTTEVAILSLGEAVAAESIRVGGNEMDRHVADYLRRHFNLRIGLAAAEQLRIEIGSAHPLDDELTADVRGLDGVSGLPRKAIVTSEAVREALGEPLSQIVDAVRATLDRATPDLAGDLVDHGLVLSGGGALVRGLDRFLSEQTGIPARLAGDPLTTVARGALLCMEQLGQWRRSLESSDDDV